MNKNVIAPVTIIIVAALIGGVLLFFGGNSAANEQLAASDSLRELELSVPGMFCAGCSAGVEGSVSSIPGVKRVQARLTPTKSATVIYDSDVISKEEIIENQIFDLYGVKIITDEKYSGSISAIESDDKIAIPQEILEKSRQVALLLQQRSNEGKDVSAAQDLFYQVDNSIEQGDFANAGILLDTIISLLQNL